MNIPTMSPPVARSAAAARAVTPSIDVKCLLGCAVQCGLSIAPCILACFGGPVACLACIGSQAPGCVSCITGCF